MDGEDPQAVAVSDAMRTYFDQLQKDIDDCYTIAKRARSKGLDPSFDIEIPQALDLAQRVEELVGPKNIAPIIRKVTKKIGNRELVSLDIARYIANGKNFTFGSIEKSLDQAIRTGLAILTEGVLVAPLEGIAEVKLGTNHDGSNYVDLYFSGPIRSAGGTGQAMSVLIADVVRRELGINAYLPTENEIERYKEEIPLYKRIQHLQYTPSADEIHHIVSQCPICINGEGTEQEEVTGNRDLPRVEGNRIRGGACLVIAEGLCLKAPKLLKHVSKLKLKGWDFLDLFVNKNKNNDDEDTQENQTPCIPQIPPSLKYVSEVIAGRPVFSHPSRKGGFRLRYGRARTAGLASTAIHPSTMFLLNEFIAIGTQMKMERPGKATIGTPCSNIDPPIVLTYSGDLIELTDPNQVDYSSIKEIIDAGDILIPFGEFLENNALLPNAAYTYEWWIQELQLHLDIIPEKNTFENISNADNLTQQKIDEAYKTHIELHQPSFQEALFLSQTFQVPLHPSFNLFWHDVDAEDVITLAKYICEEGEINEQNALTFPIEKNIVSILVDLCALHRKKAGQVIIDRYAESLLLCLGLQRKEGHIIPGDKLENIEKNEIYLNGTTNELVSYLAGITIREKAPFRIGTRMGRPEKAAERKMRPPPHVLFPLGNFGTNQRLFSKAMEHKEIDVQAGQRICSGCGTKTFQLCCDCGKHTEPVEERIEEFSIDLTKELNKAKKKLHIRKIPDTIKGVQGTISKHKTPEPIEKGILRAKHDVSVFKDGTIRFDMTDAPITHFKPHELHISIDKLKSLGYTHDYMGKPIEHEDQICELKVQDVIISQSCAEYFMKIANFVDDLLFRFYKTERFYNLRKIEDLTGHLVIGLAPHTSGGSLARIIGFTNSQVCYAHPFYHAAKRRNCFDYHQRVFLFDKKNNRFIQEEIGELIENRYTLEHASSIDAFGTERIECPKEEELYAYNLNSHSGLLEKKKVTCFIKGKTNHWVQFKTSTNRVIKVTSDHDILVINNHKLIVKKARELSVGDKVPIATHHPYENTLSTLNLAHLFQSLPDAIKKDIKLRNSKEFFKQVVEDIGREKILKICNIHYQKSLSKWYKSVPLTDYISICNNADYNLNDLPSSTKVGLRRDHVTLPLYITDIKSLFWILGMYCAEGWSRSTNSAFQVSFRSEEKKIRDTIRSKMKSVFSLTSYDQGTKITYSCRLLVLLFTNIFHAGSTAYEKKVPEIVYHGGRESIRAFISAFFDGDGSISINPDRVTFYSVSQMLMEGIATLLLKENIFARYSITKERLPEKKVLERYLQLKEKPVKHILIHLVLTGKDKYDFASFIRPVSEKKKTRSEMMSSNIPNKTDRLLVFKGKRYPATSFSDYTFDFIKEITEKSVDQENTYCLDIEGDTIEDKAIYWHNQLLQIRCDGDEDGLMLLMDALLNFSHEYIPDKRGGKMDLPLILTTRLDPSEVDKEAHNVDCLYRYPLKFYEATLLHAHPKEWEKQMDVVGGRLGTPLQYEQFGFTHDTDDIAHGPIMSRYKTLKTMMDKMNAQLNLAAKIRAVDEADVAYKVIERHFLPDILGNLRAFSKQSVRCVSCNITYRRIPLNGLCRKCHGKLSLTVHEKSVKKYLEISKEIADKYHISPYASQRINLVEKNINSLFSSDKVRKTKLTDFF